MRRSVLYIGQILEWADAHHGRTGSWPQRDSGQVWETADEKWINIDTCLRLGFRGLRPGGSLARLLMKHRGKRNRKALPRYTVAQILKWADAHHALTGSWPHTKDGPIQDATGESWLAIDMALRNGLRGLRGGSSLAKLLHAKRHVPNHMSQPRITQQKILAWADAHRRRTGNWPIREDGPITDAPSETWSGIDHALRKSSRGLREKSSLALLLAKYRGVRRHIRQRPLTTEEVLKWADAHFERTGKWPRYDSGLIPESPGETWQQVHNALRQGKRGLPGGETLTHLIATHRQLRSKVTLPRLKKRQILDWAKSFYDQHGYWPTRNAGQIPKSRGETWCAIDNGLKHGGRGLKGGTTLSQLIRSNFAIRVSRLVRPKKLAPPSSP
jgi:hypothetical protein